MPERRKLEISEIELNMTPMIDVVFQLLIFFIVTAHANDELTQLKVNRGGEGAASEASPPSVMINIYNEGYTLNEQIAGPEEIYSKLGQLARINKGDQIIIRSSISARHEQLVYILDLCDEFSLTNLAIQSTE
jgi:biopolymer transport protein ExbD